METIGIHCNCCWKEIIENDRCIITSCSHIFCDNCASNKLCTDDRICPICDNSLVSKDSLFGTTIDSSFEKNILLFGLSPKKILSMAEKAIEFFNYQTSVYLQSYIYQAQQSMNQFEQLKKSNEQLLFKIESLEKQLKIQKDDGENDKREIVELTEKLAEKTRQKRKLEELYLSLKENMNGSNYGIKIENNNNNNTGNNNNNNNNNNNYNNINNGNIGNISNNSINESGNISINNLINKNNNQNNNNSNTIKAPTYGFKLNQSGYLSRNSPTQNRQINGINNMKSNYRSPSFCSSPITVKHSGVQPQQTQPPTQQPPLQQKSQKFIQQNENMAPPKNITSFLSTPKKPFSSDKFSFVHKSTPSKKGIN
ncbi:hypothetical protein ACTFIU_010356 [Dictyostelium citrinum]